MQQLPTRNVNVDVLLKKISGQEATLQIDNKETAVNLKLTGVYNLLNAAAATALARQITGPEVTDTILSALPKMISQPLVAVKQFSKRHSN